MTDFDHPLDEVQSGDVLTITLESGETFENVTMGYVEREHPGQRSEHALLTAPFHGDLWDQVQDRVDSEELELRADAPYGTEEWTDVTVTGHVWEGEVEEMSVPKYVDLGEVQNIESEE